MHQPCRTCPFRDNPVEPGSAEWLIDVMKGVMAGGLDHSCHLSDRKADLVAGESRSKGRKRHCIGYLAMMKVSGSQAIGSRALRALATGELDWDKIPTRGVFTSMAAAIRFHAKACGIDLGEKWL